MGKYESLRLIPRCEAEGWRKGKEGGRHGHAPCILTKLPCCAEAGREGGPLRVRQNVEGRRELQPQPRI